MSSYLKYVLWHIFQEPTLSIIRKNNTLIECHPHLKNVFILLSLISFETISKLKIEVLKPKVSKLMGNSPYFAPSLSFEFFREFKLVNAHVASIERKNMKIGYIFHQIEHEKLKISTQQYCISVISAKNPMYHCKFSSLSLFFSRQLLQGYR